MAGKKDDINNNDVLMPDDNDDIKDKVKNAAKNKQENNVDSPPKKRNIVFILTVVFGILGAILILQFWISGGKAHQQTKIKEQQTALLDKHKKKGSTNNSSNDGKKTSDSSSNLSKNKKTLIKYSLINNKNTLILLKMHDGIATLSKDKNLDKYRELLSKLRSDGSENNNILGSIQRSGYEKLYKNVNHQTEIVNKLIDDELQSNNLQDIQDMYNKVGENMTNSNRDFIAAYQEAAKKNKVAYSVKDNGNIELK